MFGFDDIAGFAHDLETAFDQLRKGQLAATADLINLALAAGDQIKAMLDEAAGSGAADRDRSGGDSRGSAPVDRRAGTPRQARRRSAGADRAGAAERGPARDWHIRFRPGPDVLLNGTNPLLLLRELRRIGRASGPARHRGIPPLGEIDPERCYLAWDMVLTPRRAPEAIRDVFIFVEDDCELAHRAGLRGRPPSGRKRGRPPDGPLAARPSAGRAPRRASACRPTSWTSLSTWWASW